MDGPVHLGDIILFETVKKGVGSSLKRTYLV